MGRHTLRAIMVLGVLVTLVGGTGIFAVFTDRATAGPNDVSSGTRPRSVDLKIEPAVLDESSQINCDAALDLMLWDQDDTTTAQFSAANIQPGADLGYAYLCLKNVGSSALVVTAAAIDLADIEDACTGDEEAAGDATCGAGQAGELSPLLLVGMDRVVCSSPDTQFFMNLSPISLDQFSSFPIIQPVSPDEVMCIKVKVTYPTPLSDAAAQQAQSDSVSWRFAFDATAN